MKLNLLRALFVLSTCAAIFVLALALERPAYAYVDPGAGLLILQSAGSALLGVLLVFRRKIARILRVGSRPSETATDRRTELTPE
jgi:hypothetical protein